MVAHARSGEGSDRVGGLDAAAHDVGRPALAVPVALFVAARRVGVPGPTTGCGSSLLPVGITPTTEAIELIRYGDVPNRKPTLREDGIREWSHPNTGAPGVALVDTPGTGSVFQKHETVAKSFLHRSDLVIFVVSAKRALAETERLYLELAKNYGKKIILVVNQIDLLQPKEPTEVRLKPCRTSTAR